MPRKTVYTDLASSKRNKREIIQLIQQFAEKNRIGAFAPPQDNFDYYQAPPRQYWE